MELGHFTRVDNVSGGEMSSFRLRLNSLPSSSVSGNVPRPLSLDPLCRGLGPENRYRELTENKIFVYLFTFPVLKNFLFLFGRVDEFHRPPFRRMLHLPSI